MVNINCFYVAASKLLLILQPHKTNKEWNLHYQQALIKYLEK